MCDVSKTEDLLVQAEGFQKLAKNADDLGAHVLAHGYRHRAMELRHEANPFTCPRDMSEAECREYGWFP